MQVVSFSHSIARESSAQVSNDYFGTVVKSGISPKGTYKNHNTINGLLLEDINHTTLSLDELDIGSIRYPGGTESRYFRIGDDEDIAGLHRAIDYCARNNLSLNFTLHDTRYIKDTATQQVFLTAEERAELRQFIQSDLIGYAQEKGVVIDSIHIGNEFQGRTESYGQPAWQGYAKVCAVLVNELDRIFDENPNLQDSRPDFVIQPINWQSQDNQNAFVNILLRDIGADGQSAALKIDAVDVHGAGTGGSTTTNTLELTWEDYFGTGDAKPYEENIARMARYWQNDPRLGQVGLRNDAWAYADTPNLKDAALGMLQIHTASEYGFESVTNYIGYGPDASALVRVAADQASSAVQLTAGGMLFDMMNDELLGTRAVTLAQEVRPQEEAAQPILTRVFEGDGRMVLYIVNRTGAAMDIDLVTRDLLAGKDGFQHGIASAEVTILGSEDPSLGSGTPTQRQLALEASALQQGQADFSLTAYEIAQITLTAAPAPSAPDTVLDQAQHIHALIDGLDTVHLEATGNAPQSAPAAVMCDTLILDHLSAVLSLHSGANNQGLSVSGIRNIIASRSADTIMGNQEDNTIIGKGGDDQLSGFGGHDQLCGNSGADQLFGGKGDDTLSGGRGADTLFGGLGRDQFRYFTPEEGGDIIKDFTARGEESDMITLRSKSFAQLPAGQLSSAHFTRRAEDNLAQDDDDRFIYQESSSTLWFDMDGTGALPPSLIAKLDGIDEDEEGAFSAAHIWLF